jgi:hypothetical protein
LNAPTLAHIRLYLKGKVKMMIVERLDGVDHYKLHTRFRWNEALVERLLRVDGIDHVEPLCGRTPYSVRVRAAKLWNWSREIEDKVLELIREISADPRS